MGTIGFLLVGIYFSVMAVLCVVGLHRYHLVYLYYRYRNRSQGPPDKCFDTLPRVTVQLPVYNEEFVVEELLEAVCALDYPKELLQIQVLDDSTDETCHVLKQAVSKHLDMGCPVEYLPRTERNGFKAGALQSGLDHATGELIAIFDSDFTPNPDFLQQIVHYFTDTSVGIVQARWVFRNRNRSLLTRLQAMLLDGHFVFEHGARARAGRFFNFNGTAGVLRKAMIEDSGGWQHDTLTEDTDLSYRAQLRGWNFLYAPHIQTPSELPLDMTSFQVQQARWAKGLIQTARKLLPGILRSNQPLGIKVEAVFHLTANLSYPLLLLLVMMLPTMLVRQTLWSGSLLWLDLPAFLVTFCSLACFYLLAQHELKQGSFLENLQLIPLLIMAGIGLSISNTRAVLAALLGVRSEFVRTAKYGNSVKTVEKAREKYAPHGGWRVIANLLTTGYCAICLGVVLHVGHWFGVPLVSLLLSGFGFTGLLMLQKNNLHNAPVLNITNETAH